MMVFYELSAPDYETDQEDRIKNPVKLISKFYIPSIDCNLCGKWSSSNRIRTDIEPNTIKLFKGIKFLNDKVWFNERGKWAKMLNISESEITPGAEIGLPEIELKTKIMEDFLHLMPGNILVTSKVVDILKNSNATGVEFIPVKIITNKMLNEELFNSFKLWELKIKGSAWRKNVDREKIIACENCERKIFPNEKMEIDIKRWDNSDFFNIDYNPNIIIISSRIKRILENENLTNYKLKEILGIE